MKRIFYIFVACAVSSTLARSQPVEPITIDGDADLKVVSALPKSLKEASGLQMTQSGLLWSHNDDRFAILYALDTSGAVVKTVHLNERNNGWEDLARDSKGNFYIGAFGNNRNDRKNLAILKIPDPDGVTQPLINAELIRYSYSDQQAFPPPASQQNFDADALICRDDSLYIFTKNRTNPFTGYTKIYRVPNQPGEHKALLYDSLYLGDGDMLQHWVTGADLSPDGEFVALLSHECLWLVTHFQNNRFSSGKVFRIPLKHFSHKAGLCFASRDTIYIVDELEFGFLGGQLYMLNLDPVLRAIESVNGDQ